MENGTPLYIVGMHGMGDNIHQRAIIRQLRKRYSKIYLETSWPQIYHDMPDIRLVNRGTSLRTQMKNATANLGMFEKLPKDFATMHRLSVFYRPEQIRRTGSVLGAMMEYTGCDIRAADFSLPIPPSWKAKAQSLIDKLGITKPILIYRPLVERTEWSGCANRNPDWDAYGSLIQSVREKFFVISIADTVQCTEWIVGRDIEADAEFHEGELDFETIAALIDRAAMVYGSPGFAIVLARSLDTPVVCVFGGYEDSRSFNAGPGRYLGIDPIRPCQCFSHTHRCDKRIDIDSATRAIKEFANVSATEEN